jgi:hypothetical protein
MKNGNDGFSNGRRRFLGSTGRAGLLALGAPALAAGWAEEAPGATDVRRYTAGTYGLELDGIFAGYVSGFSGGYVTTDAVKEKPGPDFIQRKHPGPLRTEPITIETGLPMAKPFYEWIKSGIEPSPKFTRKSGAIIEYDMTRKEMGRRAFTNALITEVEFPPCDGASKDPARLTVTFAPETVRLMGAKGSSGPVAVKGQPWLRNSFKLMIPGLDTVRTSKIEALEVKVETVAQASGEVRDYKLQPATIQVPNLVITVADTSIGPYYAWLDDFLVAGHSTQDKEKTGTLEYMTPDLKNPLVTLTLYNLGILKVAPETAAAGAPVEAIRRSRVEMYCEAIRADFKV